MWVCQKNIEGPVGSEKKIQSITDDKAWIFGASLGRDSFLRMLEGLKIRGRQRGKYIKILG